MSFPEKSHVVVDTDAAVPDGGDVYRQARRGGASTKPNVMPLARALSILAAFTPHDHWLNCSELALRSGLPRSTVSRMTGALASLGYLSYSPERRSYRLAASVLSLGYAAIANSDVQRSIQAEMRAFAEHQKVHLTMSVRDRLEMIVLESFGAAHTSTMPNLPAGTRIAIASSPIGWALLGALPELERYYLLENVERRMPQEWSRLRRYCSAAIAQVHTTGFCTSPREWVREFSTIAVPLMIPGHPPLVVACTASDAEMSRARVERELGPRLVRMAADLQQSRAAES
jgi:DNA-binding IclR family transcriptional regulator